MSDTPITSAASRANTASTEYLEISRGGFVMNDLAEFRGRNGYRGGARLILVGADVFILDRGGLAVPGHGLRRA